ncbi:PEP-CTERM sorting domain-containing protein [Colwellia ponticola]|uniref:PEP-CTERM sorting domain-containing protein n=1 Tax=Colwellia ponticola TaxID=2304625 RepID=A0A8H2JNK6_9GAMM|nr:PEP-CTERM sorting domain-containing protein [Colwellia ponticola]TMM47827.1 PEP-CTERM sorting domain-containing protein [Colwellia ponticola]
MNIFAVKTMFFLFFLALTLTCQATLITNLTETELDARDYSKAEDHLTNDLRGVNYITYKGYDWAWVSPVNAESFGMNTLYGPQVQKNWTFADDTLLNILKTELTLADFTNTNGDFIQSTQFFNSFYSHVDANDFVSDFVSSEFTEPGSFMSNLFSGQETFYVRELATNPGVKPIPEPATLLIFVLAIIALASNKKVVK